MEKTLFLYKRNDTWLFDDPEKAVFNEPFVEGSSEIISKFQNESGESGSSISLTFSNAPFEGHQYTLQWKDSREAGIWNQYYCEEVNMYGWLCPVLLKYFECPPEMLYVAVI